MLMTWKHILTLHIFPCCSWFVFSLVGIEQDGLPPGDKTTPNSAAWKGERSRWMQTVARDSQQSTHREEKQLPGITPGHRQPCWQLGCLGNEEAWARRRVGSKNHSPLREDILSSLFLGAIGFRSLVPASPSPYQREEMDVNGCHFFTLSNVSWLVTVFFPLVGNKTN